jgi:hypothetical protein
MNREPSTYNQPETRRDNYKLTVPNPKLRLPAKALYLNGLAVSDSRLAARCEAAGRLVASPAPVVREVLDRFEPAGIRLVTRQLSLMISSRPA